MKPKQPAWLDALWKQRQDALLAHREVLRIEMHPKQWDELRRDVEALIGKGPPGMPPMQELWGYPVVLLDTVKRPHLVAV